MKHILFNFFGLVRQTKANILKKYNFQHFPTRKKKQHKNKPICLHLYIHSISTISNKMNLMLGSVWNTANMFYIAVARDTCTRNKKKHKKPTFHHIRNRKPMKIFDRDRVHCVYIEKKNKQIYKLKNLQWPSIYNEIE